MPQPIESVPLHQATADRYLSYALSVITSRALPDVRDGLKPVQRRILYTMYADMGLAAGSRYRKCAGVVGEVMGKYHPHGDQSIYDALVRMAQDFSLRAPLVDGQGNFGSLDGDPPAAMRYTECRLRPIAEELLSEIGKETVDFRPSYDGQRNEPVVLPAQLPHLLVNGSEGIAVGMATRIPPHNLGEVVDAAVALIDDRSLTVRDLLKVLHGPDFPTGGRVLATPEELAAVYETGQGSLKVRATWSEVVEGKHRQVIVDSVPFGQNKAKIVEHIGEEVRTRRLPQVVDVRDESTDEVRVVLDLAPGASAEVVMAYLFKRTDLQTTWPVNLTALVPTPGSDVPSPARLDLKQILEHWLDFRLETVRRRYAYDLEQLRKRIHILEGFALVFDGLDDAIRIIRASAGREQAAKGLIARFALTGIQADAVLDLRLYRLAQLEIEAIREELADKRAQAARIEKLLGSERKLWAEVRKELEAQRKHHATPRRTMLGQQGPALQFDEDAYIVAEDTYVVVSRDGWLKRQSSFSGLDKVRLREGDGVGWLVRADTRSTLTFFTNRGGAYVVRVDAIPQTTGHGEPVQAMFSFGDVEVVVGVSSDDPRNRLPARPATDPDDPPTPFAAAVTATGRGLRFSLAAHTEVSNRTGRRYARLEDGDQIVAVWGLPEVDDRVTVTTSSGRRVQLAACELPLVRSAGKGAAVVAVDEGERVVSFVLGDEPAPLTGNPPRAVEREHRWVRAPVVWDQDREAVDPATLAPYRELPRIVVTPEEREAALAAKAAARAEREAAREVAARVRADRQAEREAAARDKEALAEAKRLDALERQAAREAAQQRAAETKAAQAAAQAAAREAAAQARAEAQRRAAEAKAAQAAEKAAAREAAAQAKAEADAIAAEAQAAQ
ncbi:MAG: DNA topoisomerase (ATP-hydrolyzing), partial [Myxococcota bacterium]